jgi:Ca2+-binding EF-hand superfamily protein
MSLENENALGEREINFIMANTNLTREKILEWNKDFVQKCPQNKLNRQQFIMFFKSLVRKDSADIEKFCDLVFKAFDTDNNSVVDFGEFLIAFWIRAEGNLREKLTWLFSVYTPDRSNHISKWDFIRMLKLIYSVKNISGDYNEKSEQIFSALDRNKDGKVTLQEFIAECTRDEELRNLLAPF